MWSNTFLSEYPTYTSQYAMELLHSLGSKFDINYMSDDNLRNLMINFAKRDSQCFYQLALHAYWKLKRQTDYNLFEIFTEDKFIEIQDFLQETTDDWVCSRDRNRTELSNNSVRFGSTQSNRIEPN